MKLTPRQVEILRMLRQPPTTYELSHLSQMGLVAHEWNSVYAAITTAGRAALAEIDKAKADRDLALETMKAWTEFKQADDKATKEGRQ